MWYESQKPIIALAPMADMTDSPFCRVCREVAGDDFVIFREMVSSEAIVRENQKTLKMCEFDEVERPIVIQLFGASPEIIAKTAKIVVEKFSPDGIDINMGCPVPKITGKNLAGAALMKDHEKAVEIVKKIKAENLNVPVSVKTRLGWSKPEEILEFAPKLEEAGADLITIHGRTKTQGYSGQADWGMIARAKQVISIPVLANGDVKSPEDARVCLAQTGADGVMIGRGALGNPWILNDILIAKDTKVRNINEIIGVVLRHANLHLERYGEKSMVTFRKHLACYFSNAVNKPRVTGLKEFKKELMKISSLDELAMVLRKLKKF